MPAPMGYKHDPDEIVAGGVALVLDEGLSRLSFGRLAKRMGISDRSIVYYFPTKPALVEAVVGRLGQRLFALLDDAFGAEPLTPDEMARRAWPALSSPEADGVFALWFQLVGLASAGIEPYEELARVSLEAWIAWLAPRLVVDDDEDPAATAASLVATIDGLLLVRAVLGPRHADAAAAGLGLARPGAGAPRGESGRPG